MIELNTADTAVYVHILCNLWTIYTIFSFFLSLSRRSAFIPIWNNYYAYIENIFTLFWIMCEKIQISKKKIVIMKTNQRIRTLPCVIVFWTESRKSWKAVLKFLSRMLVINMNFGLKYKIIVKDYCKPVPSSLPARYP